MSHSNNCADSGFHAGRKPSRISLKSLPEGSIGKESQVKLSAKGKKHPTALWETSFVGRVPKLNKAGFSISQSSTCHLQ